MEREIQTVYNCVFCSVVHTHQSPSKSNCVYVHMCVCMLARTIVLFVVSLGGLQPLLAHHTIV